MAIDTTDDDEQMSLIDIADEIDDARSIVRLCHMAAHALNVDERSALCAGLIVVEDRLSNLKGCIARSQTETSAR